VFEKFYVKQKEFTGNRVALLNKSLTVSKTRGYYHLQVEFGSQGILQSKVKFRDQFNFAGQMIYNYEGKGWFKNQNMNFTIESKTKLSNLIKGIGYNENEDKKIDDYEIHIFYYPTNEKSSLYEENIYFYPVKNKEKEVVENNSTHKLVSNIIELVSKRDPILLAKRIQYPFSTQYPLSDIKNEKDFVETYNKIFTEKFIRLIESSDPDKDWSSMGWRGIMFGNGDLWIDDSGKIIAINYKSSIKDK